MFPDLRPSDVDDVRIEFERTKETLPNRDSIVTYKYLFDKIEETKEGRDLVRSRDLGRQNRYCGQPDPTDKNVLSLLDALC
jgi:hypothetical protein